MERGGDEELLVVEAAQELNLKERQVRNLFYGGLLPGRYRSARKIVIFASSIRKFQEKLEREKGVGHRQVPLFTTNVTKPLEQSPFSGNSGNSGNQSQ